MRGVPIRPWAALFGLVLVGLLQPVFGQEPETPPLSLTSRLLFGIADYSQPTYSKSGPSATFDSDLMGYWRSPRIFQFEVRPTVTLGTTVPGTDMGNSLTGFSANSRILQGSSFPFSISYARSGTSLQENGIGAFHSGDLHTTVIGTTNTVLDMNWTLRFRHLPVVSLDYKDSEYSSELPTELGSQSDRKLHHFGARLNYRILGWNTGAWYQRTKSKVVFPNLLSSGIQRNDNDNRDIGLSISRYLPLHSSLAVSGDESTSSFRFDDVQTDITVRNANATLISQPLKRLTTNFQAQYSSNLQAYQLEQVLAGAGIPGGGTNTGAISTGVPLSVLAAPYHMTTVGGGIGYLLGHGLSISGSAGESTSSNSGNSMRWSFGPGYQRAWRSGTLTASYSHSNFNTEALIVGTTESSTGTRTYQFFYQVTDSNSSTVNVSQNLPHEFRLTASTHFSTGSIKDNGIPYPNHDYGGTASLTRIVGAWTFTGSFDMYRNDARRELLFNENRSTGISFTAAFRGLNLSASHEKGSGMAVQVGDTLVWVNNPGVVSPLLGAPVNSSTSGNRVTGSYRSRSGRFTLMGHWGRFNYKTEQLARNQYTLFNIRATYKLRRLRLSGGCIKQAQAFGSATGAYDTRTLYFQVERNFRIF